MRNLPVERTVGELNFYPTCFVCYEKGEREGEHVRPRLLGSHNCDLSHLRSILEYGMVMYCGGCEWLVVALPYRSTSGWSGWLPIYRIAHIAVIHLLEIETV